MHDQQIQRYYTQYQLDHFIDAGQVDQFTMERFAKGATICELDEPIEQLYFFVEGQAKVILPTEHGRQLLLCFYQALQVFGDLEIVDLAPRAATTIEVVTPCLCLALRRSFVVAQLAHDPGFMHHLYRSLGKKLHRVIRNSALNLLHPLENRVASSIVATAQMNQAQQLICTGILTQIADALGTSFRHLHRTLQALCDQGLLVKAQASYRIQQLDELEQRAAGVYILP